MIFCNVEIDLPKGPAGILCSGGADSSLLLYLIAKNTKHDLHVFTLANKFKKFSNTVPATNVVNYVINSTQNYNIKHHIYYAPTQNEKELSSYPLSFLKKDIQCLYIGDTSYPDDETNESFAIPGFDSKQSSIDRAYGVMRPTKVGPFVYPFTNYTKQKIAECYTQAGIMDMFDLTRSCENQQNTDSHCGVCWWCNERRWAFGRL